LVVALWRHVLTGNLPRVGPRLCSLPVRSGTTELRGGGTHFPRQGDESLDL
jgi:hypothetical protein